MLTVIILTFNEKIHITRCINSAKKLADKVIVIDSFSSDNTVQICTELGAKVYQNEFINNAQQFQWALDNCEIETQWVMKMDADEYITDELVAELKQKLHRPDTNVNGYKVKCRLYFMGKWIKRGYYPMVLNRIFKKSKAYMEQKWMDEHIQLTAGTWEMLENDIVDENFNTLTWWTTKHNNYATREALIRLDYEYGLLPSDDSSKYITKKNKRIFLILPLFLRGGMYFVYRYILKGGFLDGFPGLIWHTLQAFWFQFLIDAKIYQIKYIAKRDKKSIAEVMRHDFGLKF